MNAIRSALIAGSERSRVSRMSGPVAAAEAAAATPEQSRSRGARAARNRIGETSGKCRFSAETISVGALDSPPHPEPFALACHPEQSEGSVSLSTKSLPLRTGSAKDPLRFGGFLVAPLLGMTRRKLSSRALRPACHPEPFALACHPEPFALPVIPSPSPWAVITSPSPCLSSRAKRGICVPLDQESFAQDRLREGSVSLSTMVCRSEAALVATAPRAPGIRVIRHKTGRPEELHEK